MLSKNDKYNVIGETKRVAVHCKADEYFDGGIIVIGADGIGKKASADNGQFVVGWANGYQKIDADGTISLMVGTRTFTGAVAQGEVGKLAYPIDDEDFDTNSNTREPLGRIISITADETIIDLTFKS